MSAPESLETVEARLRSRLEALARTRTTARGDGGGDGDRESDGVIHVDDLAFVLFDVLADAFRSGRETHEAHEAHWSTVVASGLPVTRAVVDRELVLVGAYATIVALRLTLGTDASGVERRFLDEFGGLFRLRRRLPSRWQVAQAVEGYEQAHAETATYVPVARRFAGRCGAPDDDVLARIALEAFAAAAVGTVNAIRSVSIRES